MEGAEAVLGDHVLLFIPSRNFRLFQASEIPAAAAPGAQDAHGQRAAMPREQDRRPRPEDRVAQAPSIDMSSVRNP
jgi:hypothetical protein